MRLSSAFLNGGRRTPLFPLKNSFIIEAIRMIGLVISLVIIRPNREKVMKITTPPRIIIEVELFIDHSRVLCSRKNPRKQVRFSFILPLDLLYVGFLLNVS
jgi:hypothetical protein